SYLERLPDRGPDGRPLRWHWMSDKSRLGIISSEQAAVRLKFIAQAFGRVRRIQLKSPDADLAILSISPDKPDYYETPALTMGPGTTFLELNSLDGSDSPGEDARRLSIAVFRLELVEEPNRNK